jgi:hypothetical protein
MTAANYWLRRWEMFSDLVFAASAAVQAIDEGEPAIGKMYLEAALLQINDNPEALE